MAATVIGIIRWSHWALEKEEVGYGVRIEATQQLALWKQEDTRSISFI